MTIQARRLKISDLRQCGFGLIELMIAMAIGLFLIAGVGYVFVGSKASYNTLEALSRIQESARYAFDYMGEDIRMAGFSGGPASSCTDAVSTPSTWDGNLKELCAPDPYSPPPYGPLIGYDAGSVPPHGFPDPPAWRGGDAITVVHADVDQEYSLTAYDGTSTFTLGTCPKNIPPDPGDILVAADYTHAAVFQVNTASGCPTGGTVTHNGALGAFGGDIGSRKLYPIRGATYFIGTNPAGEPALYRYELDTGGPTATEIVEGVENMQIEYGEDADDTDDLNEVTVYRATAGEVTDWTRVLSVRITLSMVSASGTRLVSTGDGLLHKEITSTIAVRNRLQ